MRRGKQPDQALKLLADRTKIGLKPDVIAHNADIKACCEGEQPRETVELLATMQQWSTAINAYEESKQPGKARKLLAATLQLSMEPDVVTSSVAVSACVKASCLTGQWSSWRGCRERLGATRHPVQHCRRCF